MQCEEDTELIAAIKKVNPQAQIAAFGGSCDMAFSTAPSVVMGPGVSNRSHAPDEYIEVQELEEAVEIL